MTMNSQTTTAGDMAMHIPAAWKPPPGSTRFWSIAVAQPADSP